MADEIQDVNGVDAARLLSYIDRVEHIEEEKKALQNDITKTRTRKSIPRPANLPSRWSRMVVKWMPSRLPPSPHAPSATL